MTDDSLIQIYRPEGDVNTASLTLSPQIDNFAGCRIGVLDNGKPNAAYVMTSAAQQLADRVGATLTLVIKKGPGGRSANAAVPCAQDVFEQVVSRADIVITGAADCGSCSAYSVTDTIRLERAGVPTVLFTTTRFERVVNTLATNGGMPAIRKAVLEHPIGGADFSTLEQRASGIVDRLIQLFTGSPSLADERANALQKASVGIEPLRALVAADGADLEVDRVDDRGETVWLRLILPDENCRACVLPSDVLAGIALERLAGSLPGLRSVVVLDPRDQGPDGAAGS